MNLRREPLHGAIHKAQRRVPASAALRGRRVSIPQEVFGFDDDDGISFQGTILQDAAQRCLVRFDYTGEEEWFPRVLTRRWVLREVPVDPLCAMLQAL